MLYILELSFRGDNEVIEMTEEEKEQTSYGDFFVLDYGTPMHEVAIK